MASNARLYQEYVEVLASGDPAARTYQYVVEILSTGKPAAQVYQIYAEVLATSRSAARFFQEYVEVLTDPSSVNDITANDGNLVSTSKEQIPVGECQCTHKQ